MSHVFADRYFAHPNATGITHEESTCDDQATGQLFHIVIYHSPSGVEHSTTTLVYDGYGDSCLRHP